MVMTNAAIVINPASVIAAKAIAGEWVLVIESAKSFRQRNSGSRRQIETIKTLGRMSMALKDGCDPSLHVRSFAKERTAGYKSICNGPNVSQVEH